MNRMAPPKSMAEILLADSPAGILVYEGDSGNCILANQSVADMLGGSVGALRLQNFRALASWRQAGLDNLAEAVLFDGLSKHQEVTLHTDFGRIVSLDCFISRFDLEGRPHLLLIVTDITEREQAQAKLTRERALLRCLIDSVSDLIFIKDRDGVYRGCNKAGEAFIGMPECEQIGRTDEDFFGREKAEQIRKADRRVLEEGKPLRVEERVTGRDGRRLLMDTIKAPYYDPGGEALGLVGIGRDITDRKLAEQERLAHLRFFENMDRVNRAIQTADDLEALMRDLLDVVLAIFDCGRAFLVYPCDPEAPTWRIPMERCKTGYPGVRDLEREVPMDPQVAESFRILLAADDPVTFGPDTGHPVPTNLSERLQLKSFISLALIPKVGKAWQLGIHPPSLSRVWNAEEERLLKEIGRRLEDGLTSMLASRNLRQSEEKYRRIVDTSSEGIWVLGPDTLTTFVNARMAEMLGCSSIEMIGRPLTGFMFEEDVPDHVRKMENRRQGVPEYYERRFRRQDGQTVWTHVSAAPILDAEHHFNGSFGMFTDITERKRAETRLNEQLHLFQQLLDSIPIPVYYKDLKGLYLGCNTAFEVFTGLARKDIIGKTVHQTVPKERADKHREVDLALLRQPGMQTYEVSGTFKDGEHHDVIFSKATFVDANNRVAGTVGAMMDITERKHAERERLANLRFFENMDRVNRAIQGADDLEAMMRDLLDVVLEIFDCDRTFLLRPCDPESLTWHVPMERNKPGYPGVRELNLEMPMDPEVAETLRILLAANGPVAFGPGTPHTLPEHVSQQFDIKSFMSMAVYPKIGSPWQFGIHQCNRARIWTAEEKRFFQEIGRRLTDGLSTMLAEKALRESEKKLREAARIAHVGYWESDYIAQTIVLSEEARKIFGLAPHHGLPELSEWHTQWVKLIHPEDQHRAAQAAAEALAGGPPYNVNYRVVRPDGQVRSVHSYAEVTRDASGNPLRMFGTMIDITERLQAEEKMLRSDQRLRLHREQSPLGFLEWDGNFHAIEWNAACERIFGYTREEAIGRHAKELILPVEVHELVDGIFHDLMNQTGGQHSINENVTKDGRIIICEWFNTTLIDKDGRATGVASIINDITEQKRMEMELAGYRKHLEEQVKERTAELEKRQKQITSLNRDLRNRAAALEAANKELDAFAYSVSHDLRAPLRHICGFTEMLQKRAGTTLDEKSRHYMDTIADSAQKMGLLIDDLLAFSRMGRQAMSLRQVDLGPLVRDVIRELEPEAAGRNIVWRLGDLPALKGDAAMLRIVLGNLISNAVKFTRLNDQARIEVGCQSREKEWIIFVRDNGAGYDPAYAGKLFGVFQRLHHKDEFEGTGVGLAMVQRVIIRHGGRTWAEGQVGRGATFYFSLPNFGKNQE